MHDVADFLRGHPPFHALEPDEVAQVAAAAEIEFHPAGATIFSQGAGPVAHLWIVRSGAVEIVHHGRVLDLLGPGELFGHASMLSGLPPGFTARAAEDTLCYRIPAEVARPLLGRPAGLRYVARSLTPGADGEGAEPAVSPAARPVAELLRAPLVTCGPDTPIREAAGRMATAGAGAVVVELAGGGLGILTDRDLRSRVVAAGLGTDAPVSAAMSAPAATVLADRAGGEVLLDMLDRGVRHFPVLDAHGRVLGVVEDSDLVAVATRSSFHLRTAIARAGTRAELVTAVAELRPTLLALQEGRVAATDIAGIQSVVMDALTRRLLELTVAELGAPRAAFAWIALGSVARREAVPSSDVDCALVWLGPDDDAELRGELQAVAERVIDGLRDCGFAPDPKGAVASRRLFARSADAWRAAARSWLEDPTQEKALILASIVVDGRRVWGIRTDPPVPDVFREAHRRPELLRLLARFALSHRPPTGFLRGLVVEHSGERRGQLDLKQGGLVPIADLARWAGMAAGVTSATTRARLRAAEEAGTLAGADARTLLEAFDEIFALRLDHQLEQVRAGEPADDFVDPDRLTPLTRAGLKEAFRAVAAVQRSVAADLDIGVR